MDKTNILSKIAVSFARRNRPESISTDWGQTLLLYGLLTSYDKNSDSEVREFIQRWLNYHLASRLHFTYFCGSWGFGLLYPLLTKHFPESELLLHETADRLYTTMTEKSLRNGKGIILHNIDLPNIYIDTIYYTSAVLSKIGPYLGKDWQSEAIQQFRYHLEVLKDTDSPFYIHCEENMSGHRSQGAWARGNGWVMMTYAELLTALDKSSHEYADLAKAFSKFTSQIAAYQREDGLWGTIINENGSYSETSASAMYIYAMARGRALGVLANEYDTVIEKAERGLQNYIDEEGKCLGASEGTWPGTKEYYRSLGQGEYPWGTGSYLLAYSERAK